MLTDIKFELSLSDLLPWLEAV